METTGNPTDQITFQDVNEKVKTLETVNLRQNYTTDSAKVDTIAKGTEGVRTGIGSNGWSRVTFNGKQGYMSSKYLEKTGDNTNTNASFKDTNDTVYHYTAWYWDKSKECDEMPVEKCIVEIPDHWDLISNH